MFSSPGTAPVNQDLWEDKLRLYIQ